MHVVLVILGNVIVKYRFHIPYIYASRSHIRGHQNVGAAIAEAVHDTVTLDLLQISMKALCKISPSLELLHQVIHLTLCIAEHNGKLRRIHIQQTAHNLYLILRLNLIVILGHLRHGQFLLNHPDRHRVLLELPGNLRNGLGHGS